MQILSKVGKSVESTWTIVADNETSIESKERQELSLQQIVKMLDYKDNLLLTDFKMVNLGISGKISWSKLLLLV